MSRLEGKTLSERKWLVEPDELVLVTGAAGFVGSRVVQSLLRHGFRNLRCLVRPSSDLGLLEEALGDEGRRSCEVIEGNLLSREDAERAARDAVLIYHLVAGRGKSFPVCFQNSVVTTRNLLDASVANDRLTRFINVSSFAVYSNRRLRRGEVLDEACDLESDVGKRHDAYVYGKLKQDELVHSYHQAHALPYVNVRPGIVFGPGKRAIPGTIGIDTFGVFLHLGGGNPVPLTYADNCADAIVLAGVARGVDGEVFNIVDDNLPTSRDFLGKYKKNVGGFRSFYVPYSLFYLFCACWEAYAGWSDGQLPPVFNRQQCSFSWKGHRYSNRKAKEMLGWHPAISMSEALERYFAYQRDLGGRS